MPSKRFSPHAIALAFSWFLFGLALLFCAQSAQTAYAQDITISGNTLWSAGTYSYDNVWITNNATLTLQSDPANGEGVTLKATNLTIEAGSSITANGRGYSGSSGPGRGIDERYSGGGAGYGGDGGNGYNGAGGPAYGLITQPADLGSGGGRETYYGRSGGAGGGLIKIECLGSLIVDGAILANGYNGGEWYSFGGGGGSGGSIYITANTLAGSGPIAADGGSGGGSRGGGGAGGRIAVYYTNNTYSGTITAYGGYGRQYGAAGTIFTKSQAQVYGDLLVDNHNNLGAITTLPDGIYDFDTIIIRDKAKLALSADSIVTAGSLTTEL